MANGRLLAVTLVGLLLSCPTEGSTTTPKSRVVEIVADKDNTFKVPGQKKPVIVLQPGEVITLRVTSLAGPEKAKDGAVHSVVIKSLRNKGWDLRLKEGTKDFVLRAPQRAGEYPIECTVKCGVGHEEMRMLLVVKP